MFASVRSDAVNLPLFLHVLGALLLTGSLFTVALTSLLSWRRSASSVGLARLGYRTVLLGVFPAYLLMRIGAEWTASEENLDKVSEDVTWMSIGYVTADLGALLIVISMVLSGIGLRKLRTENGLTLTKAAGLLSMLLLIACLVTVWAMSTKPI